jgi:RNA polymerase sigma factor (sigma-70 family)
VIDLQRTFQPMITDVARSVSRNFPPNVLREDTEQALWLWLLSNQKSVIRTVEGAPEEWVAQIASTMRKVAFDHCADEKASIEQYDRDSEKYGIKQIKVLLEDAFDHRDWQSFATSYDSQPRPKGLANTTGDRVTELIDVRAAVDKLPELHYNTLVWFYKLGWTYEELGEQYDCSKEAARQRVERAVRAVQKLLGPKDQLPPEGSLNGRRAVRSNAAWRAASDNQYQD